MKIALLCCYPFFAHLAIALEQPLLKLLALALLTAGILYKGLINKQKKVWLIFLSVICIMLLVTQTNQWFYAFYIPPILLPAIIASVFFISLGPDKEPLITDIGEKARGPLSPELRSYTRRLTQLWAYLLTAMAIWSALLPWLASIWLWSIVTNFVNYIIVALFFVVEFFIRKKRFKEHRHPNFKQYLNIVLNSWGHK